LKPGSQAHRSRGIGSDARTPSIDQICKDGDRVDIAKELVFRIGQAAIASPGAGRTRVAGLFPSEESLPSLVTGVLIEISETWETGKAYVFTNQRKPKNKHFRIVGKAIFTKKALRSQS
jgi:hypothetical protein